MSDINEYIKERCKNDPEFKKYLEQSKDDKDDAQIYFEIRALKDKDFKKACDDLKQEELMIRSLIEKGEQNA